MRRNLAILVVLIAVGCAWALWKQVRQPPPAGQASLPDSETTAAQTGSSNQPQNAPGTARAENPAETASALKKGTATATPPAEPVSTAPTIPRQEPTPYTRQLVAGLTQLNQANATPETAAQWKQGLLQLVQQGSAAVPAIREFLERKQDLSFAGFYGGSFAGYPSMRAAMFDALQQIGGPEALDASLQALRTTSDPLEIALLARSLEQQAPGVYQQEALSAARVALAQASQAGSTKDVAPIFQVLQAFGGASVLSDLQNSPRWSYYATLTLASLPDGGGIPTLIQEAQNVSDGSANRSLALQMLAQGATQYPDAAAALVEQARLNQISDTTWRQIGWVLGGDQYQFGSQFFNTNLPPASGPGVRTFHIESGNQNYYTVPALANMPADQLNARRALIDQLLAVTSNPVAQQSLQNARLLLSGGQAQN